jgi:2-amino-4-hydroxy-6-hydroxymethyldihydropteridine diphosphokinase
MDHTLYLALGTNLWDRQANLLEAMRAMPPAVRVLRASPVYETEPWGFADQPCFFNQVIQAETDLAPEDLLAYLKRLEVELGRIPNFCNGPRLIDLDILLYNEQQVCLPGLIIPHPRMSERNFVLAPLADLAPDLRIPGINQSVKELLAALSADGIKRID